MGFTETGTVILKESGSRTVVRAIDDIGKSADKATRGIYLFQRAIFALGVGGAVSGLVRIADGLNLMENRLRLTTSSTRELENVQKQLFDVAKRSRSSLEGTAEIYNRMALSAKGLGLETKDLIDVTETLNKAAVLSGASTREANAALIQLGQGIASNRLGGDELRSILEQLPYVADIIAKSLGVTRGELRELGSDGKLTADVLIKAFKDAKLEVDNLFSQTTPTIGQALTNVFTEVLEQFDRLDDRTGVTKAIAASIQVLADSMKILLPIVVSLTAGFAGFLAQGVLTRIFGASSAFSQLYGNIFKGNVVILGSATALKAQSAALVASTTATVAARTANLSQLQSVVSLRAARVADLQANVAATAAEVNKQRVIATTTGSYLGLVTAQGNAITAATALATATDRLSAAEARLASASATATTAIVAQDAALAASFRLAAAQSGVLARISLALPGIGVAVAAVGTAFRTLWAIIAANPLGFLLTALSLVYIAFQSQKTIAEELNVVMQRTDEYITAIGNAATDASGKINEMSSSLKGLTLTQITLDLAKAKELFETSKQAVINLTTDLLNFGTAPADAATKLNTLVQQLDAGDISLEDFRSKLDDLAASSGDLEFQQAANEVLIMTQNAIDAADSVSKLEKIIAVMNGTVEVAKSGLEFAAEAINYVAASSPAAGAAIAAMASEVRSLAGAAIDAGNSLLKMASDFLTATANAEKLRQINAKNLGDSRPAGGRGEDPRVTIARTNNPQFKYDGPALDANNNIKVKKSGGGGGGGGEKASFATELAQLKQKIDLEKQYGLQKTANNEILSIEKTLKKSLSEAEKQQVTDQVRLLEVAKAYGSVLQETLGPQEKLQIGQEALSQLFKDGAISMQQYIDKLRELKVAADGTSGTFLGGFKSSIEGAILSAQDFGKAVGNQVVTAVDGVSDAIVKFAQTGEFNLREVFATLFANLLKLSSQQLLLKALGGLFGGAGGAGASGVLGGLLGGSTGGTILPSMAGGGSLRPNGPGSTDSQIIAFKKRPDERVDILTPGQQAAQRNNLNGGMNKGQPASNDVKIINVLDGSVLSDYLRSSEGQKVVVNIMRNNGVV